MAAAASGRLGAALATQPEKQKAVEAGGGRQGRPTGPAMPALHNRHHLRCSAVCLCPKKGKSTDKEIRLDLDGRRNRPRCYFDAYPAIRLY